MELEGRELPKGRQKIVIMYYLLATAKSGQILGRFFFVRFLVSRIVLTFTVKRIYEMIVAIGISTLKVTNNFKITMRIQGRLFGQEMQMTAWDH